MTSTTSISIFGVCFALFLIYITFVKYKQQKINKPAFLVFSAVWIGFIVMCLAPWLLDPLLSGIHFARRLDFFIVVGFIFLISLVFYMYIQLQDVKRKIDIIVEKIALAENK